ncbi:hypothetical protein [Companilactobacillus mishanensis]|uniref:hypothetical protein n=1 Tax=Companilactobacillus mishanensis TaxID=2486008 RepID=UPI0012967A2D|nr:hypothetical protein [Companilactobacillus mishanensis]MQS90225.1 hypothetical protein [Companilactobacillus mishanensis]
MRIKNLIGLSASYLLLIVISSISSLYNTKDGWQVTSNLVILIVLVLVLATLYSPFMIASLFQTRTTSLIILGFSLFMLLAVNLPILLKAVFETGAMTVTRGSLLVMVPLDMVVLIYVIVINWIYAVQQKKMLR